MGEKRTHSSYITGFISSSDVAASAFESLETTATDSVSELNICLTALVLSAFFGEAIVELLRGCVEVLSSISFIRMSRGAI